MRYLLLGSITALVNGPTAVFFPLLPCPRRGNGNGRPGAAADAAVGRQTSGRPGVGGGAGGGAGGAEKNTKKNTAPCTVIWISPTAGNSRNGRCRGAGRRLGRALGHAPFCGAFCALAESGNKRRVADPLSPLISARFHWPRSWGRGRDFSRDNAAQQRGEKGLCALSLRVVRAPSFR